MLHSQPPTGPTARALGDGANLGREVDGIWERIGPLTGRNRIAVAFYDGPGWTKFRPWEELFLVFQGGARRARRQILRHLDSLPDGARVLEVGIGQGANLTQIGRKWSFYGVDLARSLLKGCLVSFPHLHARLAWAEAEALPFADACFDACYSVGGFNYYGDHARALHEMARVTRPGGLLVVADELPHIYRYGVGRLIPKRVIGAVMLRLGTDPDFARMILDYTDDPETAIQLAWPGATRHAIWTGLGYCYSAVRPDTLVPFNDSPGGIPDAGPPDRP